MHEYHAAQAQTHNNNNKELKKKRYDKLISGTKQFHKQEQERVEESMSNKQSADELYTKKKQVKQRIRGTFALNEIYKYICHAYKSSYATIQIYTYISNFWRLTKKNERKWTQNSHVQNRSRSIEKVFIYVVSQYFEVDSSITFQILKVVW